MYQQQKIVQSQKRTKHGTLAFILSFRILIISIMATNLHPVATVAALELVWPREDQASHWQRNTSKYSSTLSEYLWLKPWCSSGDKSSIITMYCRPIADSCHNRRWCTLFKPVPFFAQRTQNFGLFWPIHKNQVMCKPSIMVLQRYPTFSTTTTTPPAPWWWGRWAACAPGLVRPQDPGGSGFLFWSWLSWQWIPILIG